MNQYGRQAQKHWQRWLPTRYSQLTDPETYFAQLGEEIAAEINDRADQIARQTESTTDYMKNLGRLNEAQMTATSDVLRELALLKPEPGVE